MSGVSKCQHKPLKLFRELKQCFLNCYNNYLDVFINSSNSKFPLLNRSTVVPDKLQKC